MGRQFLLRAITVALAMILTFACDPTISTLAAPAPPHKSRPAEDEAPEPQKSECELNSARGDIKHVIFIEFSSLHFVRDNPNVPSDLEQMPHLRAFLENNGALLTNHHTGLALDGTKPGTNQESTLLTGLYSQHPDAGAETKNAPAPWLAFTKAGCNVGAVGIRAMTLENASGDARRVFGADSLEAALAADPGRSAQTAADLEGLAIHCAAGNPLCSDGRPDVPAEDPTADQFKVLFGYRNIAPTLGIREPLMDLDGKSIGDSEGRIGFPGFAGISPAQSLAYLAAMQEHSVPITYGLVASPHENSTGSGSYGPGEAAYVTRLNAYDSAFEKFLARLAADGIDQNNTLFVITAEQGQHFVGSAPVPATCDGVNVPCTYPKAGSIVVNLPELLVRRDSKLAATSFQFAPGNTPQFQISGNFGSDPERIRQLATSLAKLTAINPVTGSPDQLAASLADAVELKLLHIPAPNAKSAPDFVLFGDPDYYFTNSGKPPIAQDHALLWNGSGLAPEVTTTFLSIVAPGVTVKGIDNDLWSDHADVRPTMLALLGLNDHAPSAGRVLTELFHPWALPKGVQGDSDEFLQLAQAYKQVNAPLAELGTTTLRISTAALAGDDAKYNNLQRQLTAISVLRDDLAGAIAKALTGAEFQGRPIPQEEARELAHSANDLLEYVKLVAANGW